jgi:signal transduction histidine kinase
MMKKLKQHLINWITFADFPGHQERSNQATYVCNMISTSCGLLSLLYIPLYLFVDFPLAALTNSIVGILWLVIIPKMLRTKMAEAGKMAFVLSGVSNLCIFLILLGRESGLQFIFVGFIQIAFLFYKKEQWKKTVTTLAVIFFAFLGTHHYLNSFGTYYQLSGTMNEVVFHLIFTTVFSIVALFGAVTTYKTDEVQNLLEENISELNTTRDHLIETEKKASMGMMAGGLAHEINNPLAIILGYASIGQNSLERGNFNLDDAMDAFKKIENASYRVKDTIEGLKFYSDKNSIGTSANFDFNLMITDLVDSLTSYSNTKKDWFTIEFANDSNLFSGKPQELALAIRHILENAIYEVKNLQSPKIGIKVFTEGENIHLEFADNGGSIDPGVEGKIFDPFFTQKPVGEGQGLGLSIVKSIIESHGGKLTLARKDTLTVFRISLPIADDYKQPVAM